MYTENDEGIDLNSSGYQNYASFVPDETTFAGNKTQSFAQKSIHFPHRLDLSTLATPKNNRSSSQNRKKVSPIKANCDSRVFKSFAWTENSNSAVEKNENHRHKETVDLQEIQDSFQRLISDSQRKNSDASVTSDRASSVCSSSSGQSQKSLFAQVSRAKKLVDQQRRRQEEEEQQNSRRRGGVEDVRRRDVRGIVEDSDWHIGGLEDESEDDTRPPSSQPSLASESDVIEQQRRRAPGSGVSSSNLMSSSHGAQSGPRHRHQKASSYRSTATNTTAVHLSDTQLYELYDRRQPAQHRVSPTKQRHQKSTTLQCHEQQNEIHGDEDDADKTIVQLAFQGYSPEMETPILRGAAARDASGFSQGSNRIERARDEGAQSTATTAHRSASLNNIASQIEGRGAKVMGQQRNAGFDGFAPGALRHSMSAVQVSPEKFREMQRQNATHPLPQLAQFVIKPSTRSIFPLPLMDIDAISGKGLRRDEKSSQRHFSGQTISNQIHGARPAPRTATVPRKSSRGADRPTTASAAKTVAFAAPHTTSNSNLPPLSTISKSLKKAQPPYCSATSSDGTAYSITTLSQQLLGTVKSLHPDWLQMTRRLLESSEDDVVVQFRRHLLEEKERLEAKWERNRNEQPFEHPDDPWTRIAMIRRVVDKLEGAGLRVSRIQQIKTIHTALLST